MIGKRIKQLRTNKKLTQSELASLLSVSDRAISKWEQLKGNPDIDTLPKLAEVLGVSVDFLLTGKESAFHINSTELLIDFISNRIKPHLLSNADIASIESLAQEHENDFLYGCFLVAHEQVIKKKVQDDIFVATLMNQYKKIVYIKSRPIVLQKMDELYYTYSRLGFDDCLSKESFRKRMYYYLNKADLDTDEKKVAYIDDTLLPIIISSFSNEDLADNLKQLLKKESPFDSNNHLTEEPNQNILLTKKFLLLDYLDTQEYLLIVQHRRYITTKQRREIKKILQNYNLDDSVSNVILEYTLRKRAFNPDSLVRMLNWAKSKNLKSARETIKLIVETIRNKESGGNK